MEKFKIGDEVLCINKKSKIYSDSEHYMNDLFVGNKYTVIELSGNGSTTNNNFIYLKDYGYCHAVDCFELVSSSVESYEIY